MQTKLAGYISGGAHVVTEQWVSFLNFLLMLFTLVSAQFMGQMSLGLIGPIGFEHWTLKHSDWLIVGRGIGI